MRTLVAATLVAACVMAMPTAQTPKQIVRSGPDLGLPFSPAVKAGGFIYVSGAVATDAAGQVSGDIKAQTARTLDGIAATLKAAGSRLDNAVSVIVYLKDTADFAAMNDVYKGYFSKDPPTRTTLGAPLALPAALVEISVIAVPDGAERRVIHPADWVKSPNPYSYGILSGDTLFLSGLVSRNGRDNSTVKGDVTAQTKTVLDNGAAILHAAGMTWADVVSSRVYLTDSAAFQAMNDVYRPYFTGIMPARATVKAALTTPDYLVEITMTAVKGTHEAVTTPGADGRPGPANPNLSSAVKVGNRLWLSGMLGNTADNAGNVGAQTTETMTRIGRTLRAAGFDWPHVVEGMVYLPDVTRFTDMNAVYRDVFKADFPARTTAGTGLMSAGAAVEIMMLAVK